MKQLKCTHWVSPIISGGILILYFIVLEQLFAYHWFELAALSLPVLLFFLVTLISSAVFWLINRNQYSLAYLPFCIHLFAIVVVWFLPSSSFSKKYPEHTELAGIYSSNNHDTKLYKENYFVAIAATPGEADQHALYLTDSINFRLYLGQFSDFGERINLKIKGDSVFITNPISNNYGTGIAGIVKQRRYSIKYLQAQGVFQ